MDSWTNEQVDVRRWLHRLPQSTKANYEQNMRKVGNVASNQIYNSENKKPHIPVDADEADSAMERFIRQKYSNNQVKPSRKQSALDFDDETPPPPPPKETPREKNSKFGFRSALSLTSKSKKDARQAAAFDAGHSIGGNIPSRTSSRGYSGSFDDGPEETERKLAQLRDMGFMDNQRNAMVLKGVTGNLERAVEALVRLGEGKGRSPIPSPQPPAHGLRTTRSLTPLTTNSMGLGAGLTISPKSSTHDRPLTTSSPSSNNPFDNISSPAPPQTAQSTGTLQKNNPYANNPFGAPAAAQQTDAMSEAFQNMQLNNAQQPLFPNNTGNGGAVQQPSFQQAQPQLQLQSQQQQAPFATMPSSPQNYQPISFQHSMTYPQPVLPQATGYNPYYANNMVPSPQQQHQQQFQNPAIPNGQAGNFGSNPFARSPTRIASPSQPLMQIPEQTQSIFQPPIMTQQTGVNPFFSNPVQSQSPAPISHNPYAQIPQQQPPLQSQGFVQQQPQQYMQQNYQQQGFQQQQTQPTQAQYQLPRHDKASIMALFGQTPQMQQQASAQTFQNQTIPEDQAFSPQPNQVPQQIQSSSNPFFMNKGPVAQTAAGGRQISRESMNLGLDMAWANGRHSPDAFANLSARQ